MTALGAPWLIVEAGTPLSNSEEFCDWLRRYDVDPNSTYRVDIYRDKMRVYQYDRNDGGRIYRDESGDAAVRDPFSVAITFPFGGGS